MLSHSNQTIFQPKKSASTLTNLGNFANYAVCLDATQYYHELASEINDQNTMGQMSLLAKILTKQNAEKLLTWFNDSHIDPAFLEAHHNIMDYLLYNKPVDMKLLSYYMVHRAKSITRQYDENNGMIDILDILKSCYIKNLFRAMIIGGFTDILDQTLKQHPEYVNCDLGEPDITLLHLAILTKQTDMVATLVKHHVDINKNRFYDVEGIVLRDHEEYIPTPLCYAILISFNENNGPDDYYRLKEIVKILLDHGADPEIPGVTGSAKKRCELKYKNATNDQREIIDIVLSGHKNSLTI